VAVATSDGDNKEMLLRAFDNAVMPLRCVFCGTRTQVPERYICAGCCGDLSRVPAPPPPLTSPLEFELAAAAYEFPVVAALKALKFQRKLFYAPAFAELLCMAAAELPNDIDAVLPVPLHWRRRWFRGFNQAVEIGRPVAKHLDVPLVGSVRRVRATSFQSGLSAPKRAQNLRSAFAARGALWHQHVLLVDDVITTGTTVRQIARVLKQAGVEKVSALAVARAL
jgi:ComF family protein